MDEAGLLNSMTVAELAVTCERMQRSCGDMEMLLNEFQMEQDVIIKEQDRLGTKIEKVSSQLAKQKKDRGSIWNFVADFQSVDERPDIAHILKRVEERQAAAERKRKRSNWSTPERAERKVTDDNDSGPFSSASLKMQPFSLDDHTLQTLRVWLQQSLCEESVAEAERIGASAEIWMDHLRQFSATFEAPGDSPDEDGSDVAEDGEGGALRRGTMPPRIPPQSRTALQRRATAPAFPDGHVLYEGEDSRASRSPPPFFHKQRTSELGMGDVAADLSRAAEKASGKILDVSAAAEKAGGKLLDWFGIDLPSGSASRETVVLTVTLQRSNNNEKWGLAWVKDRFNKHGERIVEKTVPNFVAGHWNTQQMDLGHPERCIMPQDRLISANGKTKLEAITAELKGKEVVLEFQRIAQSKSPSVPQHEPAVDRPDPAAEPSAAGSLASAAEPSAAAGSSSQAPAAKGVARPKFAAAFSAYVQAAKSGNQDEIEDDMLPPLEDDALPPLEDVDEDEMLPPLESPSRTPVADQASGAEGAIPAVAASVAAAVAAADEVQAAAVKSAPDGPSVTRAPRSEAPFSVVAQVLRLSKVSVQLSWLFDWEAAPEFSVESSASRSFVVLQRTESSDGSAADGGVTRLPCARSPVSLDLPTGRRYVFEVQAVLLRIGYDACETGTSDLEPLWTSPASTAVSADLRDATPAPARPPLSRAGSGSRAVLASSGPSPKAGSFAASLASSSPSPSGGLGRPGAVAGSIGAFLAQRAAGAPSTPATPSGASSEPVRVMGGSAAEARSAKLPHLSSLETRAAEVATETLVSGSFPADSGPAPAPKGEHNPLASAQPRVTVSSGGPLNPAAEKREVAAALRRRGGEASGAMPAQRSRVWRNDSGDSDDGMLQQLAQSMKKLEWTVETVGGPSEPVPVEGLHGLQSRIEDADDGPAGAAPAPAAQARGVNSPRRVQEPSADPTAGPDADMLFRLTVQTGEGNGITLEFSVLDNLQERAKEFVTRHKIHESLQEALVERLEAMSHSGTRQEVVDLVDLV